MSKIILFGNSPFVEFIFDDLRTDSPHEVVAFTVDARYARNDTFMDLPLVPFESVHEIYPPDDFLMFIPMSYRGMNRLRAEKYMSAKARGYKFISYVASTSKLGTQVRIGENCYIGGFCVFHSGVRVGNNIIMGGSSFISHHSVIEDHCFLTAHCVFGGFVTLKRYVFVGLNVTIRDHVTIGEATFLNAGVVISKDTKANEVYEAPKPLLRKITSDKIPSNPNRWIRY